MDEMAQKRHKRNKAELAVINRTLDRLYGGLGMKVSKEIAEKVERYKKIVKSGIE